MVQGRQSEIQKFLFNSFAPAPALAFALSLFGPVDDRAYSEGFRVPFQYIFTEPFCWFSQYDDPEYVEVDREFDGGWEA